MAKRKAKKALPPVALAPGMTLGDVARVLGIKPRRLIRLYNEIEGGRFDEKHVVATTEAVELIAVDLGRTVLDVESIDVERRPVPEDTSHWRPRPPVVTIMGHVDHGKTTLLDSLRQSSIAEGEAGGITQHIGAFSVDLKNKDGLVTFLDTPGHSAFSAMRERGARVTDIVVLVVAADDGVMPQTIESIKFAKDAGVHMVVAINKCDRPNRDIANVMQGLAGQGVELEAYGGSVPVVEISALRGTNISALVDLLGDVAELLELKADPEGLAEGVVIEAKAAKGKGIVATVVVQQGTLAIGSHLVCGTAICKVKGITTADGKAVKTASPSMAVEVMGWRDMPEVGADALAVDDEARAKAVATQRQRRQDLLKDIDDNIIARDAQKDLDKARSKQRRIRRGRFMRKPEVEVAEEVPRGKPEVRLVVKADVAGSEEALVNALSQLPARFVDVSVVRSGVGPITASDVETAALIDAQVLGFNVPVEAAAERLAEKEDIPLLKERIVYRLLESVTESMIALLPPLTEEVTVGEAVVGQVFKLTGTKKATVAGCSVRSGQLQRKGRYKVYRGRKVIHDGTLASLKHKKEDVASAARGTECGLALHRFLDVEEGDVLSCYEIRNIQRTVNDL